MTRQLTAAGNKVIATTRNRADAAALNQTSARVIDLDVSDPSSIAGLAERVGPDAIDVVINNAGVSSETKSLANCSAAELQRVFMVNATAPVLVAAAVLENVKKGGRKLIVNISSQLASIRNNTGGSSYAYRGSKAALNMLTACMANELRPQGITCVALHPGWVKTDMGGEKAPMSPEQSARFILLQAASFGLGDSGSFRNYDGSTLPW